MTYSKAFYDVCWAITIVTCCIDFVLIGLVPQMWWLIFLELLKVPPLIAWWPWWGDK